MQIQTKFSLGQKVYPVVCDSETIKQDCPLCNGTGYVGIAGANRTITCPDCCGRGYNIKQAKTQWHILKGNTKIGEVRVNVHYTCNNADDLVKEKEEQYMLYCSGVGSGTLWSKDLYATEEQAQKECDKRNNAKKKKKS